MDLSDNSWELDGGDINKNRGYSMNSPCFKMFPFLIIE